MLMMDDTTPEQTAGRAVRALREQRGMSQRQLAEAMAARGHRGWIQTTVAKVEAASRPLRVNELVALAAVLGAGVEVMLTPTPYLDMTPEQARAELERLTAELSALNVEAEAAEAAAAEAREQARAVRYHRGEVVHLLRLLRRIVEGEAEA